MRTKTAPKMHHDMQETLMKWAWCAHQGICTMTRYSRGHLCPTACWCGASPSLGVFQRTKTRNHTMENEERAVRPVSSQQIFAQSEGHPTSRIRLIRQANN